MERRVVQLEMFIKNNKLQVPADANLSDADLKKMEKQAQADKKAAEEEAAKLAAANEQKAKEDFDSRLAEATAAVADKFSEQAKEKDALIDSLKAALADAKAVM